MFGKNEIAKARADDFSLHSIWPTLQGEGPWAGRPAIFVRLAGCNLRCFWCDTDFSETRIVDAYSLALEIKVACAKARTNHVVITGGEPLLQPLPKLFLLFQDSLIRFQIETSGSAWPEGMGRFCTRNPDGEVGRALLVVSPKTGRIRPEAAHMAGAWKYIVQHSDIAAMGGAADGLPHYSTQVPGQRLEIARPSNDAPVYVQPLDEDYTDAGKSIVNQKAAAAIAMAHGYRLSLQMHKIVGVD